MPTASSPLLPTTSLPRFRPAIYPFRGIGHFLRHKPYHRVLYHRIVPFLILSLVIYVPLFVLLYLPQVALLAIFQGRAAWFGAAGLVLGEGYLLIQGIFEGFFLDHHLVDLFDATLIDEGLADFVAPHRELYRDAPNSMAMLGPSKLPLVYSPFSFKQILELVICLPLNFIPYVGLPLFIVITGSRMARLSHYRWFKMRGMSRSERNAELRYNTWDYTWFGAVAMALEMIPVFSFFFLMTTACGAAIWAARLEKTRQVLMAQQQNQQDQQQGHTNQGHTDRSYIIAD